jgi:hypothetical protein
MTVYLDFSDFKLKATGVSDYPDKKPSLFTWNTVIEPIAERIIKNKINGPFENGPVPIGGIL